MITINQGRAMLGLPGLPPEPVPPAIVARVKQRVREIEEAIRHDTIRREGAAKLAAEQAEKARLRRTEESTAITLCGVEWSIVRLERSIRNTPIPLDAAERHHRITLAQTGTILPRDAPYIARWIAHIAQLARTHGVQVQYEPHAAGLNAYAFPVTRRIETPPITSAEAYAVALHELAHVLNPCQPTHRRVTTTAGRTACVEDCEITAWRDARRLAEPIWMRPMQAELVRSLKTYLPYATVSGAREIRALMQS